MIDERKELAMSLLIKGDSVIDIAKLVGVNRNTIYNWQEEEEFKAEMGKRKHDIILQGNNMIVNELNLYVSELKRIALCGKSEKVRSDTSQYLIDRVLGKTTTRLEVDAKTEEDSVTYDILEQELNSIENV